MNSFEDWSVEPGEDEVAALLQRSAQLRILCEEKHTKARENIVRSQEKNRERQDGRAKNRLIMENLKVGATVYVRTGGLRSKVQPRTVGPYTIETVGLNNYKLRSATGKLIQANIDRIVPVDPEVTEQHFEVKKIHNHRKGGQGMEYLVEWDGYPMDKATWVIETDFDTSECLNEYWTGLDNSHALRDQGRLKPRDDAME